MSTKNNIVKRLLKRVTGDLKAMPGYVGNMMYPPEEKQAREMRTQYGLTGHGNNNTNKDQQEMQKLIKAGKVIEANAYAKKRKEEYRTNWK